MYLSHALATCPEKLLEHSSAVALSHAPDHFWPVMTGRLIVNARSVLDPAPLRVLGEKDQATDPGKGNGLRTHRAGF